MNRFLSFVTTAALLATVPAGAQMQLPGEQPAGMPAVAGPLTVKYKTDADRILTAAMADKSICLS